MSNIDCATQVIRTLKQRVYALCNAIRDEYPDVRNLYFYTHWYSLYEIHISIKSKELQLIGPLGNYKFIPETPDQFGKDSYLSVKNVIWIFKNWNRIESFMFAAAEIDRIKKSVAVQLASIELARALGDECNCHSDSVESN